MAIRSKQIFKTDPLLIRVCSALLRKNGGAAASNADDILQDACLRILELKEPQTIREPERYARRVVRNRFLEGIRKQKRLQSLFDVSTTAIEIPDDKASTERVLAGKLLLSQLLAEIDRMPVQCKEAFVLHRFENLTYPAIARQMGVSISVVEKHIAEAMARLIRARDLKVP